MTVQVTVFDNEGFILRFRNFNSTREQEPMTLFISEALSDFKAAKIELRKWR